jgi:5'-deoxynucleotidase
MKKIFKLFGFLDRLRNISRWGLMFSTRPENVKEHSWDVATIAHALAVIRKVYYKGNLDPAKASLYALYHDASEAITGDMPTPVKYFSSAVKAAADEVEKLAICKMVGCLPEEMKSEYERVFNIPTEYYPLVKAADRISAFAKCQDELKRGNDEFIRAVTRISAELVTTRQAYPEVDYFLDHFFPGFQMSLDSLCEGNGSWIIDGEGDKGNTEVEVAL